MHSGTVSTIVLLRARVRARAGSLLYADKDRDGVFQYHISVSTCTLLIPIPTLAIFIGHCCLPSVSSLSDQIHRTHPHPTRLFKLVLRGDRRYCGIRPKTANMIDYTTVTSSDLNSRQMSLSPWRKLPSSIAVLKNADHASQPRQHTGTVIRHQHIYRSAFSPLLREQRSSS